MLLRSGNFWYFSFVWFILPSFFCSKWLISPKTQLSIKPFSSSFYERGIIKFWKTCPFHFFDFYLLSIFFWKKVINLNNVFFLTNLSKYFSMHQILLRFKERVENIIGWFLSLKFEIVYTSVRLVGYWSGPAQIFNLGLRDRGHKRPWSPRP